ncbi:MAG: LysR family transcriptional regulator [Methanomassiliicoccaceae archaeon]|nr:LysR family transcriptional regulator [Methanomassiliicoccaceae archaeon]
MSGYTCAVDIRMMPAAMSGRKRITDRQTEVLKAVHEHGSINAAAASLGISASVAFRHIKEAERSVSETLLRSTPRGSVLTEAGKEVLGAIASAGERLSYDRRFTVACSPVTEELLMSAISSVGTDADLVISDDEMNMRMLRKEETDLVILDDPVHVFDDDSLQWQEIGLMGMVHVDKGSSYIRYRYGAQRIAFRQLDTIGKEYSIDSETLSLNDLLDSGKSFFIDEVLLMRKGMRLHSSTDPALLRHSILAVYRRTTPAVERLIGELQRKRS